MPLNIKIDTAELIGPNGVPRETMIEFLGMGQGYR